MGEDGEGVVAKSRASATGPTSRLVVGQHRQRGGALLDEASTGPRGVVSYKKRTLSSGYQWPYKIVMMKCTVTPV